MLLQSLKLHFVVFCIDAAFCQQLFMCAALGNVLVIDDDDFIGIADGGKAVGDGDGGTILRQFFQAFLDMAFAFVIESACRLIQNQNRRILKEYPGDRNPLLLSAGKPCAPLADKGHNRRAVP